MMDRFPSMHDEDIDKLGIPNQQQPGGSMGEGGWQGRKRARELSELKGRLDRAAQKEQQSWDLLKQAVGGSCSGKGDGAGRFMATGTNRAEEEMRDRTVGLVTAEEFRKAREAAESLEKAEEERRINEQAAEESAKEVVRRKADKKRQKAEEKRRRLEKSKMSFAMEDDVEENDDDNSSSPFTETNQRSPCLEETAETSGEKEAVKGSGSNGENVDDGGGSKPAVSRDLKGAAADEDNTSAAALLKARLTR